MAVSKQTFANVRDILEQLDNRISEARERRTGSGGQSARSMEHERQFGAVARSEKRFPEDTGRHT